MQLKPDGRMYSRITRRSVAIIKSLTLGKSTNLNDLVDEIILQNLPEFFLKRFNRQISESRLRDYLRFLRDINVFHEVDNKYVLRFRHRNTDREWAQGLSDQGLLFLSKLLEKTPGETPEIIKNHLLNFHKSEVLPSLEGLSSQIGIVGGGRKEEIFKWAMYLYTDGEACPLDIRHFPVLVFKNS